jgi:DNA gyrase subunit A
MQSTFSINLLALVDGEPRTLTLKQALRVYVEHRLTVIKRRAEFDLAKAKARAHILEGYLIALKNLDEIIQLIRNASDVETARQKLMKRFKLTELQATAILDMQLRRLAALERKKIETEYKEVATIIKDLIDLLKSQKRMRAVVADELLRVKVAYGDRRRTQIVNLKKGTKGGTRSLTATDLISEQIVWIGVTAEGIIARTHEDKAPRPSGNDAPHFLVRASTTDTLYLVAENGKAAAIALHTLPEIGSNGHLHDGIPYFKASPLTDEDKLATVFSMPAKRSEFPPETCVITISRFGMVKKSLVTELPGPSAQTFVLARVNEGDRLGWVGLTDGLKKDVLLVTSQGMAIRFKEDDVRPMGLVAAGVNGIKLDDNDELVGAEILPAEGDILLMTSEGKAKRVNEKEFPSQGRYGKGVNVWSLPKNVTIAGVASGKPNHIATIHISKGAPKSARLDAAGTRKRASTKGDAIVEVKPGETVTSVIVAWTVDRFVTLSLKEKVSKEEGKKERKEKSKKAAKASKTEKKVATKKTAKKNVFKKK